MEKEQYRLEALKAGVKLDLIKLLEDVYTLSTLIAELNDVIDRITSPDTIEKIAVRRGNEETAKYLVYKYVNTIDLALNFIYEHSKDFIRIFTERSTNLPSNSEALEALKKLQFLVAIESRIVKMPPGYILPHTETLPELTLNAHENSYKTLLKWCPNEEIKGYVEESHDLYELIKTIAYEIGSNAMKLINKIAVINSIEATKGIATFLQEAKEEMEKEAKTELPSGEIPIEEAVEEIENLENETEEYPSEINFDEEEKEE